jgi:hypothetical protein
MAPGRWIYQSGRGDLVSPADFIRHLEGINWGCASVEAIVFELLSLNYQLPVLVRRGAVVFGNADVRQRYLDSWRTGMGSNGMRKAVRTRRVTRDSERFPSPHRICTYGRLCH